MGHAWTASLLAVVTCLVWSPGQAQSRPIPARDVTAGPVLAGSAVLWAEGNDEAPFLIRADIATGQKSEAVRYFPRTTGTSSGIYDLAATAEGYAFRAYTGGPDGGFSRFSGRFGAAYDELGRCPGEGVAVAGGLVAFGSCGLRIAPLDRSAPERVLVPGGFGSSGMPRIAGQLVAGVERRRTIVVYDLATERVLRTITAEQIPGRLVDYDVRADGTVVVAYERAVGRGGRRAQKCFVGRFGVGRPSMRPVPVPTASKIRVRLRGSRLVYVRTTSGSGEIGVLAPGGRGRRIAAGALVDDHDDFDFDGRLVAWKAKTSAGLRVFVRSLR